MDGQIRTLNGAPWAGKTTPARARQAQPPGTWAHLGVDAAVAMSPTAPPPGGERLDLVPFVVAA